MHRVGFIFCYISGPMETLPLVFTTPPIMPHAKSQHTVNTSKLNKKQLKRLVHPNINASALINQWIDRVLPFDFKEFICMLTNTKDMMPRPDAPSQNKTPQTTLPSSHKFIQDNPSLSLLYKTNRNKKGSYMVQNSVLPSRKPYVSTKLPLHPKL